MSDAVQPEPVPVPVPPEASPSAPYDPSAAAPAKRPIIMWDLVLTIVLLVLMIGAALLATFLSFFLAFAGDSCGASSTCNYDLMASGMMVAMIGPLAVGLIALIAAVVVLVLKRIAFWIPLVGIVLIIGVFIAGFAITASGVTPATP